MTRRPVRPSEPAHRPLWSVVAVVFLVLLSVGDSARAQSSDVQVLINRLDRLERDIRILHQQWARGGPPAGTTAPRISGSPAAPRVGGAALARLEVRISNLEVELRNGTGRAEELGNQIYQLNQRLEKLIGDMEFRLSALERGQPMAAIPPGSAPIPSTAPPTTAVSRGLPGVPPSSGAPQALGRLSTGDLAAPQAGPQAAKVAPAPQVVPKAKPVLPEGTPKEQYNYALRLLRVGKIDEAEKALTAFVGIHPQDTLAANAEYWLGETYYVRQDYVTAGRIFAKSYQNHKDGAKAADSLLKLGMSLGNLKKTREACATFDKLEKDFPKVAGHVKSTIVRQRKSVGCN